MSVPANKIDPQNAPNEIWSTRCPVPTASGIALKLGWLEQAFAGDGIRVHDARGVPNIRRDLGNLEQVVFREGGNIPILAARAQGAPNSLIGLTFIDEGQSILVRPDSGISAPEHLKGKRVALPEFGIRDGVRQGSNIARGMTLQGLHGALRYVGLGLDDVRWVEVGPGNAAASGSAAVEPLQNLWAGLDPLAAGEVDAVYVKGASAVDAARRLGLAVGIDLDALPERRFRINNGTPRPITVENWVIEQHFELVVRFLHQSLRAAAWGRDNLDKVREIYAEETRASADAAAAAYRNGFHLSLQPDLSEERVGYLKEQKDFLLLHGFLDRDFDIDAWIDPRPLAAAQARLAAAG